MKNGEGLSHLVGKNVRLVIGNKSRKNGEIYRKLRFIEGRVIRKNKGKVEGIPQNPKFNNHYAVRTREGELYRITAHGEYDRVFSIFSPHVLYMDINRFTGDKRPEL